MAGVVPLWHAEVVVGPLDHRAERVWRYEECTFVSATISAAALAGTLEAGATQSLLADHVTLSFGLNTHCNFQRKPCFAQFDEPRLAWPSVLYTVGLVQPQHQFQPPIGFLIGRGAPAIQAFSVAFRAFFTGNYAYSGANNPALGQLVIRRCDLRGRILGVAVQPTGLEVETDGSMLEKARIELMAVRDRADIEVAHNGATKILLPQGLPEDAWLWLRSDDDWLDYRSLGTWEGGRNQDVRDERSVETALDLAALVAQGESQYLEFKSQLPDNNPPSRRAALKTIAAFANGEGGTVLYGVDDSGTILGLVDGGDRTPDRFNDILRSWTSPMPTCSARIEHSGDRAVLVVEVDGDSGTIHALTVDSDKPEYYVRRGATTFHARPEKLQAIASSQQSHQSRGLRSVL